MDVDGTLTDGKIYMSGNGELFKAFNIKDGYGIHDILPLHGIIPVIITARSSKISENRFNELGVEELHQGCKNKMDKLIYILRDYSIKDGIEYTLSNVAYIGDDMPDYNCMRSIIKSGGITGCPSDSVDDIKSVATYVCKNKGGDGAIREFIEIMTKELLQSK